MIVDGLLTVADVEAIVASGRPGTVRLAAAGGRRQASAWDGTELVGGMPLGDANKALRPVLWWGQPGRIGIVDRMVAEEPTLQAMRLAITLPILSGEWRIEPPEDPDPRELEATDFARTALFEHLDCDDGWHGWLEQAVAYQWRGFAPSEVFFPFDRELQRTMLGLRPLLPWTVRRWIPRADGLCDLEQWPRYGDLPVGVSSQAVRLSAEELLNLRWMPEGSNPAPYGCLRPAWADYMASNTYRTLEAQGFQRTAYAVPAVRVNPTVPGFDGTNDTIEAVNRVAQNYRSSILGAIVLPPGYSLEFSDVPFRGEDLREAIIAKRHSMVTSVLATFLRTGETKGALALHDSQVSFFATALQQAADKIARMLSIGKAAPLKVCLLANFPDLRRFPWVVAPRIRIGDPAGLIEAIVGAEQIGALIDSDRAIEDYIRELLAAPARVESVAPPGSDDEEPEEPASPGGSDVEDEVDEETKDEAGAAASDVLALASLPSLPADAVAGDRIVRGPRGRKARAAEEVVRLSETRGRMDAAKVEQARVLREWREQIAPEYGRELATAGTLTDAALRPVPGQRALTEALAAGLRRVYRAGGESVRNELDRVREDPALRARIVRGDAEVGRGGDLPAPARAAECKCADAKPWHRGLRGLVCAARIYGVMRLAAPPKRKVTAPPPAPELPPSNMDEIDPEEALAAVATTTAIAAAARVRTSAVAALQAQGIGGAMPAASAVAGIVQQAVTALSEGVDVAAAQSDVNTIFGLGRQQELRAEGVERYLYSALLESASCDPCLLHDGEIFGAEDLDKYATPASWCEGGDRCNCLILGLPPEEEGAE